MDKTRLIYSTIKPTLVQTGLSLPTPGRLVLAWFCIRANDLVLDPAECVCIDAPSATLTASCDNGQKATS